MPKEMPGLAILLAKHASRKPGEEEEDDHSGEEDADEDNGNEDAAIDAMMEALKDSDADKFKTALKSFLELCYPMLEDSH